MTIEDYYPHEILKAHGYFVKAECEVRVKNYSKALEWYEKAADLFSAELPELPSVSDKEIWEQQFELINQKIETIQSSSLNNLPPESSTFLLGASRYEEIILSMRYSYPKTSVWSPNVVGLDSIKQLLDEVTIPLTREDIWQVDEKPPLKVLMFGPPGVGKTILVKAYAEKTGLPLYNVVLSKVLDKYLGESEKILTGLFQKAYQEKPGCILFFDEYDALTGSTHAESEGMERMKKGLLTLIDGFNAPPKNKTIIIALTNRPDLLGGAMMRRFDLRVYIPPPDYNTIYCLLEYLLSKLGIPIDFTSKEWHQVITSMLGFTTSEVAMLVRRIIWKWYDRLVGRDSGEIILRHKLQEYISQFTPYFANFDSLEPATFRFLEQAYGFPKSSHTRYSWEAQYLRRKNELIQSHPNPNIIYRRKHMRQL